MASRCEECGAEIIWATTDKGRKMPLDAKPVRGFAIRPVARGNPGEYTCISAAIHVTHFATCPHADMFRRATNQGGQS